MRRLVRGRAEMEPLAEILLVEEIIDILAADVDRHVRRLHRKAERTNHQHDDAHVWVRDSRHTGIAACSDCCDLCPAVASCTSLEMHESVRRAMVAKGCVWGVREREEEYGR
jgi:hypothetical protein